MSSKPEQKETHQANGAVLPAVPMDCLVSPDRGQLVEPSNFLGPDGVGVEVVVLESRANAKGVREEDALLENGSQSNESDDTSTDRGPEPASPLKETSFSIGLQVLFPFLLAGFGTVAAGMVLDIVQHWDVFKYVTEVFILVPALLGLKGNLEMTLASPGSGRADGGGRRGARGGGAVGGARCALWRLRAAERHRLARLRGPARPGLPALSSPPGC